MEKTEITCHTFKGQSQSGDYIYEIYFSKSLETTTRMNAMTRGLDRFDRYRKFWQIIYLLSPFKKLTEYAYRRF